MPSKKDKKNKRISIALNILLGVTVLATVLLFIFERTNKSTELKINEIAYSFKNESDWIEIYNPSDKEVSLKGYYLTDRSCTISKRLCCNIL